MQQDHPAFGAVPEGGGFKGVDEVRQRPRQPEDRVAAAGGGVVEEAVADLVLFFAPDGVGPVGDDHVVQPLIGGAGDGGGLADEVQIFREAALPVLLLELVERLVGGEPCEDVGAALRRVPGSGRIGGTVEGEGIGHVCAPWFLTRVRCRGRPAGASVGDSCGGGVSTCGVAGRFAGRRDSSDEAGRRAGTSGRRGKRGGGRGRTRRRPAPHDGGSEAAGPWAAGRVANRAGRRVRRGDEPPGRRRLSRRPGPLQGVAGPGRGEPGKCLRSPKPSLRWRIRPSRGPFAAPRRVRPPRRRDVRRSLERRRPYSPRRPRRAGGGGIRHRHRTRLAGGIRAVPRGPATGLPGRRGGDGRERARRRRPGRGGPAGPRRYGRAARGRTRGSVEGVGFDPADSRRPAGRAGGPAGLRRRGGRRGRRRPRRLRGGELHAGDFAGPGPHEPAGDGRFQRGRQDRGEPAAGQEPRRGFPSARRRADRSRTCWPRCRIGSSPAA